MMVGLANDSSDSVAIYSLQWRHESLASAVIFMQLLNLIQQPGAITSIAAWHFAEWHRLFPQKTAQDFANDLADCLHEATLDELQLPLPQTWLVLTDGAELCGTVSLLLEDMATNHDLSPWLANVFIAAEFRGQGLGKKVVQAAMAKAAARHIKTLYLFTEDQQAFYERLGWRLLKQEHYEGEWVSVMYWHCQPNV